MVDSGESTPSVPLGTRIKLFSFYTWMGLYSLYRPLEGLDMISCAQDGAEARAHKKHMEAIFGLAQRAEPGPSMSDEKLQEYWD